eukprot:TRINITY_DN9327_c0_g1_i1.p1 TRINITY_DN9327_c0_g1~~TRINITY_DN9327_c0_g1_i1.p1  ORF type:complete len:598 (-),score=50.82 TRINITY_DN9327_c0_g1_i1:402-2090(-)
MQNNFQHNVAILLLEQCIQSEPLAFEWPRKLPQDLLDTLQPSVQYFEDSVKLSNIQQHVKEDAEILIDTAYQPTTVQQADEAFLHRDYKKAFEMYQQVVNKSNADAIFRLAGCYHFGYGVEADYSRAAALYRKAGKHGSMDAITMLGCLYENGLLAEYGIPLDMGKANKYYMKAAECEHVVALTNLGSMYLKRKQEGNIVPQSTISVLLKASKFGYSHAQYKLAKVLLEQDDSSSESLKSAFWFACAAYQGHLASLYQLGLCYKEGRGGVSVNQRKAFLCLKVASDYGYEPTDDVKVFIEENDYISTQLQTRQQVKGEIDKQYKVEMAQCDEEIQEDKIKSVNEGKQRSLQRILQKQMSASSAKQVEIFLKSSTEVDAIYLKDDGTTVREDTSIADQQSAQPSDMSTTRRYSVTNNTATFNFVEKEVQQTPSVQISRQSKQKKSERTSKKEEKKPRTKGELLMAKVGKMKTLMKKKQQFKQRVQLQDRIEQVVNKKMVNQKQEIEKLQDELQYKESLQQELEKVLKEVWVRVLDLENQVRELGAVPCTAEKKSQIKQYTNNL